MHYLNNQKTQKQQSQKQQQIIQKEQEKIEQTDSFDSFSETELTQQQNNQQQAQQTQNLSIFNKIQDKKEVIRINNQQKQNQDDIYIKYQETINNPKQIKSKRKVVKVEFKTEYRNKQQPKQVQIQMNKQQKQQNKVIPQQQKQTQQKKNQLIIQYTDKVINKHQVKQLPTIKINEIIIPSFKKATPSPQSNKDLKLEVAAIVADEIRKAYEKMAEEEGNKTVQSQEIKELDQLIDNQNQIEQQQQRQQKQKNIQQQQLQQESGTSQGEIWPRYDREEAVKLQNNGMGVGPYDATVLSSFSNLNQSEGEIGGLRDIY